MHLQRSPRTAVTKDPGHPLADSYTIPDTYHPAPAVTLSRHTPPSLLPLHTYPSATCDPPRLHLAHNPLLRNEPLSVARSPITLLSPTYSYAAKPT